MSLFRKWGFGAELVFEAGTAIRNMARSQKAVMSLRSSFGLLTEAGSRLRSGASQVGSVLAPLGIGFGIAAAKASSLAGNLEAQKLTMRILVGDMDKANQLLGMIRENAAATPFKEGDLIEGSKRLLRLTGENINQNMDLLKTMETMAALSPGKTVVDAVEGLLDATSGGGFERLKEFGFSLRAEDFAKNGRPGGKAWADAVIGTIQSELQKKTNGEDLVGALSKTFIGRTSTLIDSMENLGKGVGEALNRAMGPVVVGMTTTINDSADSIIEGFERMMTQLGGVWDSTGRPVLLAITNAWVALSDESKSSIAQIFFTFAALVTVLTPVLGVSTAVGIAIGGVLIMLSALIPLGGAVVTAIGAIGSAIAAVGVATSLLAIPLLILGVGQLAAMFGFLGTVMVLAGATMAALADRSAPLTNLIPLAMDAAWTAVIHRLGLVQSFFSGVVDGFIKGFQPMVDVLLDDLQPAFESLVLEVFDFLDAFGGVTMDFASARRSGVAFGEMLASVMAPAIAMVNGGLKFMMNLFILIMPMLTNVWLLFSRLTAIVFGLGDGTDKAGSGMRLLMLTMQSMFLTTLKVVATGILNTVAFIFTKISEVLLEASGLTGIGFGDFGIGGAISSLIGSGADTLSGNIDTGLDSKIASINEEAAEIESARKLNIKVDQAPVIVEAKIDTKVCIEDREIARANGSAAVRAGERGIGPSLPPTQRGRVLRNGVGVTALLPSEAF